LCARDEDAFREIVDKYKSLVYNACYHILQNDAEAEDISQEVFIEVYESIDKFRNESKLSTWLYRISINKSLNLYRKLKWKSVISRIDNFSGRDSNLKQIDIEDKDANNSPYSIEYKERNQVLQDALNSLSENQRIAFTLNKFEELSYQQISEIMNLSLSSVESLIHRAKINLQKKLVNYYKKT
jgi:RNA polymerase sigma-70 factor (ECF subfamily)